MMIKLYDLIAIDNYQPINYQDNWVFGVVAQTVALKFEGTGVWTQIFFFRLYNNRYFSLKMVGRVDITL